MLLVSLIDGHPRDKERSEDQHKQRRRRRHTSSPTEPAQRPGTPLAEDCATHEPQDD
jgi:hypothetical protein